jgi:hypothetical protein
MFSSLLVYHFLLAFEINGLESWVAESSVSINQVLLGDVGGRT